MFWHRDPPGSANTYEYDYVIYEGKTYGVGGLPKSELHLAWICLSDEGKKRADAPRRY